MTIDLGDTPTEAKALLVRGLASVDIVDGVRSAFGASQVPARERKRVRRRRRPATVRVGNDERTGAMRGAP
jgi:hypothetical protein